MRLIATTQSEIQLRLFEFLTSVLRRQPEASGPILADRKALHQLYAQADAQIITVMRHCVDRFLSEISPLSLAGLLTNVAPQNVSALLGLAVAANNTLPGARLPGLVSGRQADPVNSFTKAIIDTLPEAQSVPEMMLYHSLLRDITPPPETWPQPQKVSPLVASLVARSPLTSLVALDGYQNPALQPLADELLGASAAEKPSRKNGESSAWHMALQQILQQPELCGWLRRQWLDLPETRRSCRHLGLILETLRRKETYRALLLEFYESYECFRWRNSSHSRQSVATGSVFDVMEGLLRAPGSSDGVLLLNRWGNEYLLKFLPLVEIVIAEKGVPRDYRHLTAGLVNAAGRLLRYATSNVRHRIEFTPVDCQVEVRDEPS